MVQQQSACFACIQASNPTSSRRAELFAAAFEMHARKWHHQSLMCLPLSKQSACFACVQASNPTSSRCTELQHLLAPLKGMQENDTINLKCVSQLPMDMFSQLGDPPPPTPPPPQIPCNQFCHRQLKEKRAVGDVMRWWRHACQWWPRTTTTNTNRSVITVPAKSTKDTKHRAC